MALSALNGIRRDGTAMQGDYGRAASVAAITRELGLRHPEVVERGLAALVEVGAARRDKDGWRAVPDAVRRRAEDPRTWLQLDARARTCGIVQAPALFVVALALGQFNPRTGRAVLGRTRIAEVTGWVYGAGKNAGKPSNRVDRAIGHAVARGALRKWNMPGGLRLACFAPGSGPRQGETGNERQGETGNESADDRGQRGETGNESAHGHQGEMGARKGSGGDTIRVRRGRSEGEAGNAFRNQEYRTTQEHARESEPASIQARGGGDRSATDSSSRSSTEAPTATIVTAADARTAVLRLRHDDARRAMLTDERDQAAKVQDLLQAVGFAAEHPGRRRDVATAIAERRAGDATRWLLDELLDIVRDPSANVPAVLAHRIKTGALDGEAHEPMQPPPPRRPADHDAGATIRAENEVRRAQRHETDAGWLRDRVRGLVVGDRKSPAEAADLLAVDVGLVEQIVSDMRTDQRQFPPRLAKTAARRPRQLIAGGQS